MSVRGQRNLIERLRHPQTTVRWRLTLLYGGLFLICGVALLAVTYTLVAHATLASGPSVQFTALPGSGPAQVRPGRTNRFLRTLPAKPPLALTRLLRSPEGRAAARFVVAKQRISDLHQLEIESGIALAIMAIISGLLGWIVAGRVLRPLRTITATTQQLSEANLHERLALAGPRDELRTLADTIDGLLERLQGAFDAQRRFVANASHELRTPLAASRALLEMAISDRHATVASLREACRGALEEGEQQEQLIDALLALAQGERGLETSEPIELASLTQDVVRVYESEATAAGLELDVATEATVVSGDRRLLARLVSNVLQNAIRHNVPDGRVHVAVQNGGGGGAELTVSNSGLVVPADDIPRLLQPFQRGTQDRVGHGDGVGLGLSIVAAVAAAHDAELSLEAAAAGGLRVEVRFPAAERGLPDLAVPPRSVPEPLQHS
jgi:signal transduction histidine kinase